jgi:hypothetical protein
VDDCIRGARDDHMTSDITLVPGVAVRTRHSFAAAVVALAAILVGMIVTLLGGCGPTSDAATPAPPPSIDAYLAVESLDGEVR